MVAGINAFTTETLEKLSREERVQLHDLVIDARQLAYQLRKENVNGASQRYAQYAKLEELLIEVRKRMGDFK